MTPRVLVHMAWHDASSLIVLHTLRMMNQASNFSYCEEFRPGKSIHSCGLLKIGCCTCMCDWLLIAECSIANLACRSKFPHI